MAAAQPSLQLAASRPAAVRTLMVFGRLTTSLCGFPRHAERFVEPVPPRAVAIAA
jgi:hypothetical protein